MVQSNTILVTGAMGQLGRHLCRLLLGRGHTVIGLDLQTPVTTAVAAGLLELPGRFVASYVDLLSAQAVAAALREHAPDTVVHLAAIVSPPAYKAPRLARRVNVDGTRNLVEAARALAEPPFFVLASSCAVYGSRNPHKNPGRVDASTPVNPVDCYGEDKVAAEKVVVASGLRHVTLRLGGIVSPEATAHSGSEYFLLLRATPRDNRLHVVDVRDAALAFANSVGNAEVLDGKTLLIGGDESCLLSQADVQDDVLEALGVGRVGAAAGLPGDPDDDHGWGLTDWFDTREAQQLLHFQEHRWHETLAWVAASQGARRTALVALRPLLLPSLRAVLHVHKLLERRGRYADPWELISKRYGPDVLAPTSY